MNYDACLSIAFSKYIIKSEPPKSDFKAFETHNSPEMFNYLDIILLNVGLKIIILCVPSSDYIWEYRNGNISVFLKSRFMQFFKRIRLRLRMHNQHPSSIYVELTQ